RAGPVRIDQPPRASYDHQITEEFTRPSVESGPATGRTAMKAEHRKELETNVLAQQIEKAYQGLRQGPSRTLLFWVGGAVAVLLVFLLFRYFMSTSEATTSGRWLKLDGVVFPEQLDELLKESDLKDTPQGRLARYKEARLNLTEGMRILGHDT